MSIPTSTDEWRTIPLTEVPLREIVFSGGFSVHGVVKALLGVIPVSGDAAIHLTRHPCRSHYLLLDGHHRVAAAHLRGRRTIWARVAE